MFISVLFIVAKIEAVSVPCYSQQREAGFHSPDGNSQVQIMQQRGENIHVFYMLG